ncbi:MAG TPA: tRNA (cytidine(34)-2'-O)-methyltransferase [Burkholderiaceae bacterium]|nr:tRNA (cytidine(34)-2'-O)-methyltransferase [Burkholderiaceae bacterium]
MFNVVLIAPEIPPNTGNVIRLCANTGARLHLVEPLGFELNDKQLRRAGLDYHEYAELRVYGGFDDLMARERPPVERMYCCTTHGTRRYADVAFAVGDWFVFGSESRGLDPALRDLFAPERRLRLPMRAGNRSLNLSNAVAVVVYEAWRQLGYRGGA